MQDNINIETWQNTYATTTVIVCHIWTLFYENKKNYKKVYILYKLWNEMLLCMTYISTCMEFYLFFLDVESQTMASSRVDSRWWREKSKLFNIHQCLKLFSCESEIPPFINFESSYHLIQYQKFCPCNHPHGHNGLFKSWPNQHFWKWNQRGIMILISAYYGASFKLLRPCCNFMSSGSVALLTLRITDGRKDMLLTAEEGGCVLWWWG